MFNLEGFMRQAPIAQTLDYALPKFDTEAFRHERKHNIYFKKIIPDVPRRLAALSRVFDSQPYALRRSGGRHAVSQTL